MVKHFSPSENILISNFDVTQYQITPNVQEVFAGIIKNYKSGLKSINLIGAYGTGKSSFLSALEYHLNTQKLFIENDWRKYKHFDILKLIGAYDSIIDSFRYLIGSKAERPLDIIADFEKLIRQSNSNKRGVVLIIDEFGKFLEYASSHNAEKELYFLQQVAELINNAGYEAAFITTLHQDFSAYAIELNETQRNEWNKVKGRFNELTFNEPVEQLLLLASKKILATPSENTAAKILVLNNSIAEARAFPLRDYFDEEIAKKIYPLDLLSASIVVLALQQYGQNERSLFTFLNTDNFYSLEGFDAKDGFYAISNVYDYLNYNLFSFLNSKANIHYSKWGEIKNSLERIEGEIEQEKHALYQVFIKTIGLLNIFGHAGAKLDKGFITEYIELSSGRKGVAEVIEDLQKRNLISFNKYSNRFFYSETTLVDIDDAIQEAGLEVSRSKNIVGFLNGYLPLAPVSAKRAYYEKGTPRVFEYKITDTPYSASKPVGQIDGFINLIFNDQLKAEEIKKVSEQNPTNLYAHFLKADEIQHAIEEIEKAEIAKAKYPADKIIQRELSAVVDIQKNLLNHFLHEGFYNWDSANWYYNGKNEIFKNGKHLNSFLSHIADNVYHLTPTFISELANKSKLSASISTARKLLLEAIFENQNEESLGIVGFPPQKSIYLSLLHQTGIHQKTELGWTLQEIIDPSKDTNNFIPLFKASNDFITSTKGAKRSVAELYSLLEQAPYKLKKGFLDFWIPIYIIIKSDDFAMYGSNGFIPEVDAEVLELLVKNPANYSIKAFDTDGIKVRLFNQYRELLSLGDEKQTSNKAFIKTVSPFFKFYKDLKPFVKQTKYLPKKALKVRKALTDATDPEKLFFEDLPGALGFDIVQLNSHPELLKEFNLSLQNSIRDLRNCYDKLLDDFEKIINSLWNKDQTFTEYKERLRARYQGSIKQYLLLPYQRTFYDRLCSPLEDRAAWLSSVSQATIGKTLENISDQEHDQLQERFLRLIHELDNLNDMALQNVDLENEEVFKLEIMSPGNPSNDKVIRLPKQQDAKINYLEQELSAVMEKESTATKIAILANLLRKELDKDAK